jgi:hypothetical protein
MKRFGLWLLAPTAFAASHARAADGPICTDRPAKANATCTVPAGRIQVETSAAGWSLTKAAGARTELLTVGSTVAKVGLTDRSDLQVGFTPYARSTFEALGARDRISGFGDATVRYKHRLTRDDAAVQAGLIPFVKLPTARSGLGNGKAEGGVAVPISFALTGPVTMTLGPEVDVLADLDRHGRHAAIVNLVNVAASIAPRLTAAAELWSNFNFDPAGTIKQASADAALTYAVSDDLQLDVGANFGLTRDTPDIELYAGASVRF